MPNYLTREAILQASDIQTEDVEVPEWGGTVAVRGLSGRGRDDFEASVMVGKGKNRDINVRNFRAKLVALCCVDEQGVRLFSDEDVKALGDKSAGALTKVFDVASRLSGLSKEDEEDLTKNSESDLSDGSISD